MVPLDLIPTRETDLLERALCITPVDPYRTSGTDAHHKWIGNLLTQKRMQAPMFCWQLCLMSVLRRKRSTRSL